MAFCISSLLLLISSLSFQESPSQTVLALRLEARKQTDKGEWDQAQSTYRRAIQLAPTPEAKLDAQVDLMLLLLRLEDQTAARTILETVQAQQANFSPSMTACRALASIGVAYWQLGDPRRGIAPATAGLTCLEPLLPAGQLDAQRVVLAAIYSQLKAYGKAGEVLASVQTPAAQASADFQYISGMITLHRKDYAISETHFNASFAAPDFELLTPIEKATIYFGYSKLLAKLHRKSEARAMKLKFDQMYNEALILSGARHKVAWQSLRE